MTRIVNWSAWDSLSEDRAITQERALLSKSVELVTKIEVLFIATKGGRP